MLVKPPTQSTLDEFSSAELASVVAHEFRGPVHALLAYIGVLLREQTGPLTDIQRDFLTSMYSVARRLERLANDVQVMVADGRSFSIVPESVDLLALVEACRWELDPVAQGFDININLTASSASGWQLWADPIRIEQIILNLLENAIRYGARFSTVTIRLRKSPKWMLLAIENDIERELEHSPLDWLRPFSRDSTSLASHPRGLGLGLSVVAHLVTAHQGKIFVRARENRVTIAVCLPNQFKAGCDEGRSCEHPGDCKSIGDN
jgi:signal transduction histidine kinase